MQVLAGLITSSRYGPWEGEWDRGVCRSNSINPNGRILIDNPQAFKAGWQKMRNYTSMIGFFSPQK